MIELLDIGIVLFWALTYVLVIVESHRSQAVPGIPVVAILLNLSWEASVVIFSSIKGNPFWGHFIWLALDIVIWGQLVFKGKRRLCLTVLTFALVLSQLCFLRLSRYMLISVFVIDLVMALAFLVELYRNQIRINGISFAIGIGKLLGDFCAWVVNKSDRFVMICGALVLFINLIYVAFFSLQLFPNEEERAKR